MGVYYTEGIRKNVHQIGVHCGISIVAVINKKECLHSTDLFQSGVLVYNISKGFSVWEFVRGIWLLKVDSLFVT